jgi:hypothetical protein
MDNIELHLYLWLDRRQKSRRDVRVNTSQREQYGVTVHLFIGTGRSLCRITIMPLTFTIDLGIIYRGLDTTRGPRRRTAENRAPVSSYRPDHLMTGALLWLRPNSSPNKSFPSNNFTNGALTRSVHGDSGHNGQHDVVPAI